MNRLFGAIEAGGTKMVCAVGDAKGNILESVTIPTREPENTIPAMLDFFRDIDIQALGIACFGPVDLNPGSKTYGFITTTPKLAWQNFDMVGAFKELNVPIGFDTDVNGSALGEHSFGIGKDVDNLVYITIGTGVGAGVISEGKLLHGMLHPEAGHMLLGRREDDLDFVSFCPFHNDCLEGLCAGPAIEKRWGKSAKELEDDHKAWDLEAYYLAKALVNITMMLSPQRIILGGGVMHKLAVFPKIRAYYRELMNGYIDTKELSDLDSFIVPQSLEDKQGILGALMLGMEASR